MLKKIAVVCALIFAIALSGCGQQEVKVFQGLGKDTSFRVGPGKDASGTQVYSFNYIYAQVTFDKDGKILAVYVDALEVSTPNYDGETMPHFPGWPGQTEWNLVDHATKAVTGTMPTDEATVKAAVNAWKTKRERGDTYHMNATNDWYKQMDAYQVFFVGKTIAEIEAWFAKFTAANGRPLNPDSTKAEDIAKYALLTAAEKAQLDDVRSGATMSLNDSHGNIIGALKDAYANRVEVSFKIK